MKENKITISEKYIWSEVERLYRLMEEVEILAEKKCGDHFYIRFTELCEDKFIPKNKKEQKYSEAICCAEDAYIGMYNLWKMLYGINNFKSKSSRRDIVRKERCKEMI